MLLGEPTRNVFADLADWQAQGLKTGLAMLVNIDGSSPRPRGAAIGIGEDGRHSGIISSGCAEEAIIAEGLEVLNSSDNRITRYGKDSPYLDVVLPCGSGLDILFAGQNIEPLTRAIMQHHDARRPAFVMPHSDARLTLNDTMASESNVAPIEYEPDYHLHVFGAGPQLTAFAGLANMMGYKIFAHSTDEHAIAKLRAANIACQPMTHKTVFGGADFDPYCAVITLFHEHDLEIGVLEAALNSDAHFIGAMGSRKTHATREAAFKTRKTARAFSDIVGPVGLDIGATDPNEIALSVLAQIVERRRQA